MSVEKKNDEANKGNEINRWIKEIGQRIVSVLDGNNVVPESIERAHFEAAEESITFTHQLMDYMQSQLGESSIIKASGAKFVGSNYLEFPEQGKVLSLGLPDHNFHFKYGFRAEIRGETLDLKKYIDLIVEDIERKVAQGQAPNVGYELYPLRESIEFTLIKQHGYRRGVDLNQRAMDLEGKLKVNSHN